MNQFIASFPNGRVQNQRARMTSFFFKFVFLNSLLSFFASFEPSLGAVGNDGEATLRDMVGSRSNLTHGWQLVGGNVVHNSNFNFQALIIVQVSKDVQKTCTGTIVSNQVIVTAANCVADLNTFYCPPYNPSAFTVIVGSTKYDDLQSGGMHYKVTAVRRHDQFYLEKSGDKYTKFHWDIAILKINGLIHFNDTLAKITLPSYVVTTSLPNWESSNKICTAYGLGTSYKYATDYLAEYDHLQLFTAEMKLVPFQKCLDRWRNKGYEPTREYHVCSTGSSNSVCMTNNGGGLICEENNVKYLVGVATLTVNCGSESVPSVFTRVDSAKDFIKKLDTVYKKESPPRSSGVFIHNHLVAQYFGAPLASVFLLTTVFKSVF